MVSKVMRLKVECVVLRMEKVKNLNYSKNVPPCADFYLTGSDY